MPAWGSTSGVQVRIPYRTIDANSTPSSTTVSTWLDEAEAELAKAIAGAGGSTSLSGDALELFRGWVEERVAGLVLAAYASAGGDYSNDHGVAHEITWRERLKSIRRDVAAFRSAGATVFLSSYVTNNSDSKTVSGGDFAPAFTRGEKW